jgi:hypothetical protein
LIVAANNDFNSRFRRSLDRADLVICLRKIHRRYSLARRLPQ